MCGFRDYKTKMNFKSGIFPVVKEDDQNKTLLNIAKMLMDRDPKKRENPKTILEKLI